MPRAGATPHPFEIEAAIEFTDLHHGNLYGAPPVFAVVIVAIASVFAFAHAVAQALAKGRHNSEATFSPNRCMLVAAEQLPRDPEGAIVRFHVPCAKRTHTNQCETCFLFKAIRLRSHTLLPIRNI